MPLSFTDENISRLQINKFSTIADFNLAQQQGLIGETDISFIDENLQPDWNQTNTYADDYIKNKPNLSNYITSAVETTYSDLYSKVTGSTLVPGQSYRITDYVTTTVQNNTQSANHPFDLVVTAIDTNKLDNQAQAVLHNGDTYFSGSSLDKWQVWYDINNDTTKYAWANSATGKGVIYRLIDEFNNDCPYDFKNILFTITSKTANAYSFNVYSNSTCSDHSLNGRYCYGNVMKPDYSAGIQRLNFNVFYNTSSTENCYCNTFGNKCCSNTFGNRCTNNTLGDNGQYNTFGNECYSNIFGYHCNYNAFGNSCTNNTLGDNCSYIVFGNSSTPSMGGTYCRYNIVENGNQLIRLYQTSGTAGSNNQLQNVYIAQGVNNTATWLDISTIARNLSYRTTVGKESDGTLRIYNEDDATGAFVCNFTYSSNSYTCDKTPLEIYEAKIAGKTVIGIYDYMVFNLNAASSSGGNICFTASFTETYDPSQWQQGTVSMQTIWRDTGVDNNWHYSSFQTSVGGLIHSNISTLNKIPSSIGSAGQVLSVNSATTGLEFKTIIPTPTSGDTGKFVTVNSSGSYVLETVANAELISY